MSFRCPKIDVSFFIACLVMVKQLRGLARAFQNGEIAKGAFMEKSNVVLAQLTDTVVATERFDVVLPVMGYGQFCPFFWEAECETNLLQLKRAKRSLGALSPHSRLFNCSRLVPHSALPSGSTVLGFRNG